MKKKSIFLAALAVILVLGASVPFAWGYFSTYTEARGGIRLTPWKQETQIKEEVSNWTKHVVITNSAEGSPVYIRARAFAGSEYQISYEAGDSWTLQNDGFYYYNSILGPGEETPELLVKINKPDESEEEQEFNVVVVYESTPVRYDAQGNPYAGWDQKLEARERSAE